MDVYYEDPSNEYFEESFEILDSDLQEIFEIALKSDPEKAEYHLRRFQLKAKQFNIDEEDVAILITRTKSYR